MSCMFVHSNGKINVLVAERCGSTALQAFFGKIQESREQGIPEWIEKPGKKVIILRNPYDRVVSAYRTLIHLQETGALNRDPVKFFTTHSQPYFWMIQQYNFSIILFEDLSKYVPELDSNITNSTGISSKTYIKNSAYSMDELNTDYLLYKDFRLKREILDVESWNMLCER